MPSWARQVTLRASNSVGTVTFRQGQKEKGKLPRDALRAGQLLVGGKRFVVDGGRRGRIATVGHRIGGVLVAAAGVHRKPTLDDSLPLLEEFQNAPQAGKTHNGRQRAPENRSDERGAGHAGHAAKQEHRPRTEPKIVFGFHHDGVKDADGQEGAKTQQQSFESEM